MAETHHTHNSPLSRLNAVRTLVVLVMAFGYASTMATGPGTPEIGRMLGYEPSLFAIQLLFFLSGWLALRSLHRHGSGWKMLASRARRNLPLLAVVTGVVAFLVYPMIRADVAHAMGGSDLLSYFFQTVSCVDPSQVMPGALDGAHYACLLQGAIWTFRWGALFYIGAAIAWRIGLLRGSLIGAGALLCTLGYAATSWVAAKTGTLMLEHLDTALRLAYPFALGMAVFNAAERLRDNPLLVPGIAVAAFTFATVNFLFLAWTPAIEIGLTLAFCALAHTAVHSRTRWLRVLDNWPPLALPLFLLNWPLAQIWLFLQPGVTQTALIAATLGTAVLLAWLTVPLLRLTRRPLEA